MTLNIVPVEMTEGTFARALTDITSVLAFSEQAEARIQRALELLRQVVAYEHCAVLIDATSRRPLFATVPASDAADDRLRERLDRLFQTVSERPSHGIGIEPYCSPDTLPIRSWSLSVPLVTVDAIVGMLYVGRDREEYTVCELRLLTVVASQFAAYARGLQFLEQAEHARTQAEEANRAKDRFLATLSHELRTPLNVVQGWLHILRSGPPSEAATHKAITVIERNVAAQAELVGQLLDAARIATGKFHMDLQPLEVFPVITATVDDVRPSAQLKGVDLDYVVPSPRPWMIHGDRVRLRQAFANLLVNAVKFTPRGGHVRVRVQQDGSHLDIEFRDTGIGIDPGHLARLFEPLWQADGAFTQAESGLGLGLSIVRHIVKLHGGEVLAESDGTGKGATFRVRLPLNAQPAVASHPETEKDKT
jgi:signal transduction histidine kinase